MQVSFTDFNEFKRYKGIDNDAIYGPDACLTCIYPELDHFHLPQQKNVEDVGGIVIRSSRPSLSPSAEYSNTPIASASNVPSSMPSYLASMVPSLTSSGEPTLASSGKPSSAPTIASSATPTELSSEKPTTAPTEADSAVPSGTPTVAASATPTIRTSDVDTPTNGPTDVATHTPTVVGSDVDAPTDGPTDTVTERPTVVPSDVDAPTDAPTVAASAAPTVVDSVIPTAANSVIPTAADSATPTAADSATPTVKTSGADVPINGPTDVATETPTVVTSDADAPTDTPTDEPTDTNNSRGTPRTCVADENGDFRIPMDIGTVTANVIDYKYKMNIVKNSTNIVDEILPPFEKALLDSILPILFQGQCGGTRAMREYSHDRRRLSIIGASSKPQDTISSSELCGNNDDATDCNIMNGRMTVMSDDMNFNMTEIDNLLCAALNKDSLTESHSAITAVECVPLGSSAPDLILDDPQFQPVSQEISAYGFLVSAAAVIVVVLGIYGYRRRHGGKDGPNELDHLDDSDLVNMSQSRSFEDGAPFSGNQTFDFTPINGVTTYSAQGGIEQMARHSYFPETIVEGSERDEEDVLEEVSLDELNKTTTNGSYYSDWRHDSS